jgi:hypothetical protein
MSLNHFLRLPDTEFPQESSGRFAEIPEKTSHTVRTRARSSSESEPCRPSKSLIAIKLALLEAGSDIFEHESASLENEKRYEGTFTGVGRANAKGIMSTAIMMKVDLKCIWNFGGT